MGDRCATCHLWVTARRTRYDDGSVVDNYVAPEGQGQCGYLNREFPADFGCVKHEVAPAGWGHVVTASKPGAPWQHFVMIDCPDCNGGKQSPGGPGHRCAGTGKVRLYDDGYVGDERTRKHPKEPTEKPNCLGCGTQLETDWVACPRCGQKTLAMVATTIISDEEAGLVPYDERGNAAARAATPGADPRRGGAL